MGRGANTLARRDQDGATVCGRPARTVSSQASSASPPSPRRTDARRGDRRRGVRRRTSRCGAPAAARRARAGLLARSHWPAFRTTRLGKSASEAIPSFRLTGWDRFGATRASARRASTVRRFPRAQQTSRPSCPTSASASPTRLQSNPPTLQQSSRSRPALRPPPHRLSRLANLRFPSTIIDRSARRPFNQVLRR